MPYRKNIFNIPLSCSFWDTLAEIYLKKYAQKSFDLASVLFLVPNRRAYQSLISAFVRQQGLSPTILPQVVPIAEIDDDDVFFNSFDASVGDFNYQKKVISQEERLFLFTRLILSKPADFGLTQISMAQALNLAQDLANLIDTAYNQELSFDRLDTLVPEKYATHWQDTLKLLKIITHFWPQILQERDAIDICEQRQKILYQQAQLWQDSKTNKNIVIAGVTASFPSIVCLMKVVSSLENGEIYFSGIDQTADDAYWESIDESHPQYELKELLNLLAISRHEVQDVVPPLRTSREIFISEVMRPATVSNKWRQLEHKIKDIEEVINHLQFIESPNQREEALAIALKMREILEIPEKTVALITYDRNLARRVALELQRFDIKIDDSAGIPLGLSPVGIYLRLIAEAAENIDSDIKFITLLKNPFTLIHHDAATIRKKIYDYEYFLRNPKSTVSQELLDFVNSTKQKLLELNILMNKNDVSFEEIFIKHLSLAEEFASSDVCSGKELIWRGDAGIAAAKFSTKILENASFLGYLNGEDYLSVFCELINKDCVRSFYGTHPRLNILGPIEAKLCKFDYVILGEINEGIWPKPADADMWMSRPMKKDFGFSLPEKNVGILGADLCGFLSAENVIFTRAERIEGVPMKKSRWLLRMETVLKALDYDIEDLKKNDITSLAKRIDFPQQYSAIQSPAPCPPVWSRPRKLSASAVDLLVADPYSFFAKYILKLYTLDDLDISPDQRDYGSLIHHIIEEFNNLYPNIMPDNAEEIIKNLGDKYFSEMQISPELKAFWWPKFLNTAKAFLIQDERLNVSKIHNEISGEIEYVLPKGNLKFTAKADRIDELKDGYINIIDYKTGNIPSRNQVLSGHALQLLLEGLIATKGHFSDINTKKIEKLIYWHLGQTVSTSNLLEIDLTEENLLEKCESYLLELMETFDFETTPYFSKPTPKYITKNMDYEHLSRIKEWSVQEENSDD